MTETIAPPKKGMSTGAKIAIGCLVALLLCMGACSIAAYMCLNWIGGKAKDFAEDMEKNPDAAAVKAAELLVRMNPELELVDSDSAKGTLTIREKKTGKVLTVNFEDIQSGKFSFEEDAKKTNVDFDQKGEQGGTVTVDSGEGKLVYGSGDASSIPSWVPVYPGARQEVFEVHT